MKHAMHQCTWHSHGMDKDLEVPRSLCEHTLMRSSHKLAQANAENAEDAVWKQVRLQPSAPLQ